ncbi:hypothetical protein [Halomonas piscis]|uniref:hypothetical protein n=1 Tax=Halomonas piscis TaxID=3031727 RepID=UPI00289A560D|nr:hypothetical protein [Halomonas piscis]
MNKLVVHMGPHKTGSTYIQKRLHENKQALQDAGISYPDAYYLFFGHHYLLNALNGNESSSSIRKNFDSKVAPANNIIISSENFISLTKSGLVKLKEAFDDYEIFVIYYIRRPSLRVLSRWHEEVKQGGVVSAESYFVNHLFRPMQSSEVNNFRHVSVAASVFGRDSIKLVDYDTALVENNMLSFVFLAMGSEAVVSDVGESVNKMASLSEIEIIRFSNFSALRAGKLKGANVRNAFYSIYDEHYEKIKRLSDEVQGFFNEIALGDTSFDKAVHNILINEYRDVLLNKPSSLHEEIKTVPSSNWMMDTGLVNAASEIAGFVLSNLEEVAAE